MVCSRHILLSKSTILLLAKKKLIKGTSPATLSPEAHRSDQHGILALPFPTRNNRQRRLPQIHRHIHRPNGDRNANQTWHPNLPRSKPPQRHHAHRPPERHRHALVPQLHDSTRQNASSPRSGAIDRYRPRRTIHVLRRAGQKHGRVGPSHDERSPQLLPPATRLIPSN